MVMGLKDGLFFEKDDIEEKRLLVMSGVALGMFATVSSMCNSLSCHGLRVWRRVYLIPWLSFYLLILGIVATCLLTELYSHNFLLRWNHIFLFFAVFTIFYCWSHVKKQFLLMGLPRPEQVSLDVESVVRDILRPHWSGVRSPAVSQSPPGDLPPKYEDLDLPPQYDEDTMSPAVEAVSTNTSRDDEESNENNNNEELQQRNEPMSDKNKPPVNPGPN